MNENILRIPYSAVNEDWNFLQKYLKAIGNPRYIIVGDVDLLSRKDISDLGNLVGVDGDLNLRYSSIESLGELEYVGEDLLLSTCKNIKTLGKLKKVIGDLWLSQSSIESLGELEFVGGALSLWNCQKIKTLGKLKRVEGDLDLEFSPIESLGELEFVGNILHVKYSKISYSELDSVEVVDYINY
jgi:hypothetical protein